MPDVNVWLALSWTDHLHSASAWQWYASQDAEEILFCRFTQLGLLRLLTATAVMGGQVQSVGEAWSVYERWTRSRGISLRLESGGLDQTFRRVLEPVWQLPATKAIGDCYLLAASASSGAALVTFDQGLAAAGRDLGTPVVLL